MLAPVPAGEPAHAPAANAAADAPAVGAVEDAALDSVAEFQAALEAAAAGLPTEVSEDMSEADEAMYMSAAAAEPASPMTALLGASGSQQPEFRSLAPDIAEKAKEIPHAAAK